MTIRGVAAPPWAASCRPEASAAHEPRDEEDGQRRGPDVEHERRAEAECLDDEAAEGGPHHERRGVRAVAYAHGRAGALAEPFRDPGLQGRPEGGPRGGFEKLAGGEAGDVAGQEVESGRGADTDRGEEENGAAAESVRRAAERDREGREREAVGCADEPEVPVVRAERPCVQREGRGDEAPAQVEDERDEADRDEPGGHRRGARGDGWLRRQRGASDPARGRLAVVPLGVPERVVDPVEGIDVGHEPVERIASAAPTEELERPWDHPRVVHDHARRSSSSPRRARTDRTRLCAPG